MPVLLAAENFD